MPSSSIDVRARRAMRVGNRSASPPGSTPLCVHSTKTEISTFAYAKGVFPPVHHTHIGPRPKAKWHNPHSLFDESTPSASVRSFLIMLPIDSSPKANLSVTQQQLRTLAHAPRTLTPILQATTSRARSLTHTNACACARALTDGTPNTGKVNTSPNFNFENLRFTN